jgi:DNA-binding response OmpR family regulator
MTIATFRCPATRRVLVADDSPTILHILTSVLEGEGYCVVSARDGREAFRILQTDSDFVAAILDVEMPHIMGTDLARHMQTEKRLMRIPVMMMTSAKNPQMHFDSLSAGAAVFLPKPFMSNQLRILIKALELNRDASRKRTAA